jgi:hypothetical protein
VYPAVCSISAFRGEFLFVVILLGSVPALWGVEARFRNKRDQIRRPSRLQKQRNDSKKKEKNTLCATLIKSLAARHKAILDHSDHFAGSASWRQSSPCCAAPVR